MVLARVVNFFAPTRQIGVIKPSMMAFVFVILDFVSFVIQLVGGGMAGPGQDQKTIMKGIHIYMGGIGLQEFFIVVFFGLAVKFHFDMLKSEKAGVLPGH